MPGASSAREARPSIFLRTTSLICQLREPAYYKQAMWWKMVVLTALLQLVAPLEIGNINRPRSSPTRWRSHRIQKFAHMKLTPSWTLWSLHATVSGIVWRRSRPLTLLIWLRRKFLPISQRKALLRWARVDLWALRQEDPLSAKGQKTSSRRN